jgi:hypothetical protein
MLRPMPIGPIPSETARVARAAFPKGNRDLRMADELGTLFTDDAFLALFPTHGQPAQPLGNWRSQRSSNAPKGSPTAKRPMPCGAALTGNTCCAWSSRIPGSTPQSSVNFVADWSLGRLNICSLTTRSPGAASAN